MPLVTRQANQGNLFVQALEPTATWNNGDLWVDTDSAELSVNNDGTAERIATFRDVITIPGVSS